jgi:twinkle protein
MAAMIERDDIDWKAYMEESEPQQKVRRASTFHKQLVASFEEQSVTGETLPWAKVGDRVRFRAGEVSVWAGINGHGKSLMLGQVVLGFMSQDARCAIASFEMKPVTTLNRMSRQASMGALPTEQFLHEFSTWGDGRLWLYDQQGQCDVKRMAAVLRYCAAELNIRHVVIDSMMKIIRGEDDYNGQKDAMSLFTSIARDTGLHIHLVHHIRKSDDENRLPGKFDMKGSGSISDQADNVFVVWRNKRKQFDEQEGKPVDPDMADAFLVCEKQRNGEFEGKIALWFHAASQQYVAGSDHRPMQFIR